MTVEEWIALICDVAFLVLDLVSVVSVVKNAAKIAKEIKVAHTAAKTAKNASKKAKKAQAAAKKDAKAAEKAEANSAKKAAQSNAAEEASKAKNKGAAKEYVEYVGGNLLDYAVDKSVEYVDNDEKNHNKTEYDATVRGLQAREHIKKGKGKSKYKDAAVDTIKFVSDEMKRSKKDKKEKKK